MPTWPVAAGSLVVGFAVADLTGVRPLGGLVLLAGGAWCFLRWRERTSTGRAIALVAFAAACFVVSHLIADTVGTWGAVFLVAALVGGVSWALGDAA
ncbi:MAG TPA: hypothetical protein VN238_03925, partial [Solirubrobacteraceae bacterium]|nr:hypothetical protein [Solirubrobacteraceae bacterium]